jgi:hypothetical protein
VPARFRPTGRNSYWGDVYLEMAVAPTHYLRRLRDLLDWEDLTRDRADCHKGGAEYGPVPYHPAVPFKMLLLSFLYNRSERQTEDWGRQVGDLSTPTSAARYFLSLNATSQRPITP